jgi:hypothetical protein
VVAAQHGSLWLGLHAHVALVPCSSKTKVKPQSFDSLAHGTNSLGVQTRDRRPNVPQIC